MTVGKLFDPTITSSGAPLEVIAKIIDNLQHDSAALKACSLTRLSLLPRSPCSGGKTSRSSTLCHIVRKSSGYQFTDCGLRSESRIQNGSSRL